LSILNKISLLVLLSFFWSGATRKLHPLQTITSLKIAIFTEFDLKAINVSPEYGKYFIWADGNKIMDINTTAVITIDAREGNVDLRNKGSFIGSYKRVKIVGSDAPNAISIRPVSIKVTERIYDNNLEIVALNNKLKIINHVNIQFYVAGVVEAENGPKQNFEFYKAKAVICRTYALSNLRRHEAEGYHVCDQVHCQVYRGKSLLNDDIVMGASATNDIVIVDQNINLITAAFHSNCGGKTLNSEDVWSLSLPYLKSTVDTFCLKMPNSKWEKRISKKEWKNYVSKFQKEILLDSNHANCNYNYIQLDREIDYVNHGVYIPLKDIRTKFRLKSTYFNVEEIDEQTLVLSGRGYGHGIGLCQEGAMRMAQAGYKYPEILQYYYRDIHLVDISALDFFKED